MTPAELIGLIILVAGIAYWLDSMRVREIACLAGRRVCEQNGVEFLDETVVLYRQRLRRDDNGRMRVYREYRFEFASDGAWRYQGEIIMLGKQVSQVAMEPYRMHTYEE
jgi:hypothetical protein